MDLITPLGPVRVPISSWQATLQTESANYVQCVVPACGPWLDAIGEASAFVISRVGRLNDGRVIEYAMAAAPLEMANVDGGPTNQTATLSGYADALPDIGDPPALFDRTLSGVRQHSSDGAERRARTDIDWLLRPGHRAIVRGEAMVVRYINYYVTGSDESMYVGSQSS